MVHLDSTSVGPLVEFVSGALAGGTDTLFLARTSAMERDGALSMRSRRVFVQARMAVAQALRTEERAYAGAAAVELPKVGGRGRQGKGVLTTGSDPEAHEERN